MPEVATDQDVQLLRSWIRERDRAALGELFTRQADVAYRVARALSPSASDAEDAVQTAFMRVMDRAHRYEGRGSVRAWIAGIVANCARMARREATARIRREAVQADRRHREASPSEAIDDDRREQVRLALAGLAEPYRTVLSQHYLVGLDIADIAAAHRTTTNTIHSQLRRGLERLRERCARRGLGIVASVAALALGEWRCPPTPERLSAGLERIALARRAPSSITMRVVTAVAGCIALGFLTATILIARWPSAKLAAVQSAAPTLASASDPEPLPPAPAAPSDWSTKSFPATTKVLASVDLEALLTPLRHDPARGRLVADELAKAHASWGLSPEEAEVSSTFGIHLRRLWIAGDSDHFVLVCEGPGLRSPTFLDCVATIAKRRGMGTRKLDDVLIVDSGPDVGQLIVRWADGDHLIIGNPEWVDATLAVQAGTTPGLGDSEVLRRYSATPKSALLRSGFDFVSPGNGARPPILAGHLAFDLSQGGFQLSTLLHCENDGEATRLADQVRAVTGALGQQLPPEQRRFVTPILEQLHVRVDGPDVVLGVDISQDNLIELEMMGLHAAQ